MLTKEEYNQNEAKMEVCEQKFSRDLEGQMLETIMDDKRGYFDKNVDVPDLSVNSSASISLGKSLLLLLLAVVRVVRP